jgi:sulfite reductase (ferredoxin)
LVDEEKKRCHCIQLIPLLLRSAIAAPLLEVQRSEAAAFEAWKKINVIPQKQAGMWPSDKVQLGDFYTDKETGMLQNYAKRTIAFYVARYFNSRHVKEDALFYQSGSIFL